MRILSLTLALIVGGGVFVAGQKPAKPTRTLATATFRCPDATITCQDAIQGDGAPLTGNASDNGGAYITADGVLSINLSAATTPGRYLSLVFPTASDVPHCQSGNTPCRRDFTTADVTFVESFWVFALTPEGSDLPGGLLAIPAGDKRPARIKFNFQHPTASVLFTLWYSRDSHVDTDYVEVARSEDGRAWTVTAPDGSRARLMAVNQRGKLVATDEGLYAMPFTVHVTVP
jgi:hypothetical protein